MIACIMVFAMLLTLAVGNFRELLYSYAQGENSLIITDISNEEPIPTLDNEFLLEQNIKNVSIINTLSDNLEIDSENIPITENKITIQSTNI